MNIIMNIIINFIFNFTTIIQYLVYYFNHSQFITLTGEKRTGIHNLKDTGL